MLNFTPEERKVTLFLLGLALCGLVLNNLIKVNCRIAGVIYPQIQLARLNLNKVSLAELIEAKCVPVKLAQRIIEYRNLRKEFSSLEELKEVKGIGDQRYGKLKELFFVE
ncbi:MAG: helix-hairpin-helix domain-containing protein [Candidatus Methanoperedens sp.]|nr:helix-hairpin-helix domain-containing protein [Candidatus Methanoperedens sp.]